MRDFPGFFASGDRVGVFLSNEDLSVGLVRKPVDGIIGYDPAPAAHVVENVLVYVAEPEAATEPYPTVPAS
jgi:hypothetical protein